MRVWRGCGPVECGVCAGRRAVHGAFANTLVLISITLSRLRSLLRGNFTSLMSLNSGQFSGVGRCFSSGLEYVQHPKPKTLRLRTLEGFKSPRRITTVWIPSKGGSFTGSSLYLGRVNQSLKDMIVWFTGSRRNQLSYSFVFLGSLFKVLTGNIFCFPPPV